MQQGQHAGNHPLCKDISMASLTLFLSKRKSLFGKIVLASSSLFLATTLFVHTLGSSKVNGISMSPTIEHGDRIVVQTRFSSPKVGEIYSVTGLDLSDLGKSKVGNLIKRVIAGPGDRLVFHAASGEWLSINGKDVVISSAAKHSNMVLTSDAADTKGEKARLVAGMNTVMGTPVYRVQVDNPQASRVRQEFVKQLFNFPFLAKNVNQQGLVVVDIPNDYYFVMSDNWAGNMDSRYFGPVHESHLTDGLVKVRKAGPVHE